MMEKERYERKTQKRTLAKERKKLEKQVQEHANEVVGLPKCASGMLGCGGVFLSKMVF